VLRRQYDPADVASDYERHGAAAISVVTEATFFDGSVDHLVAVRQAVDAPLLRKDFIVTEYQIAEAQAVGADAVLLIAAALSRDELATLLTCAEGYGLAALVEVHDVEELDRALEAGASLVGVNSRNLRTLEVTPSVFDHLAPALPAGIVAVAESGLRTAEELRRLSSQRYDAFLIGERFMTEPRPGVALGDLLATLRAGEGV
jgi:indole-3-glycerol phosphate synthase